MSKPLPKTASYLHISKKLHRYVEEQGHTNVTLKDIQHSLSDIRVSLSKRVIEERQKR